MLTPKVQDLEQRCHQAEQAVVRLAAMAGDAWTRRIETLLTADEIGGLSGDPAAKTALILEIAGARWIREAREAVIDADQAHTRAEAEHRELAGRRDAVSRELYDVLVDFRDRCRTLTSARDARRYLGFSGRTPRTPDRLRRCAGLAVDAVRGWGDEPPVDLKELRPAPFVRRLEELGIELDAAVKAVAVARVRKRTARRRRKAAIEHCEWSLLHGARLVESSLGLVDLEELALEIRGRRRPGRPSRTRRQASAAPPEATMSPFPGRDAVREGRESFSSLAGAVRRGRESFSSRP
jgi:hypothetical protein